jgi:hypothetical protein
MRSLSLRLSTYCARIFKVSVRQGCNLANLGLSYQDQHKQKRLISLGDEWVAHSVNRIDQVAVGIHLTGFGDSATAVDMSRIRH